MLDFTWMLGRKSPSHLPPLASPLLPCPLPLADGAAAAVTNNPTGQSGALPPFLSPPICFCVPLHVTLAATATADGMDVDGDRGRKRFHEDELRFSPLRFSSLPRA